MGSVYNLVRSYFNMGLFIYSVIGILAFMGYFLAEPAAMLFKPSIFDNIKQSDLSTCTPLVPMRGCEDLKIHHPTGLTFIGCPEDHTLNRHLLKLGYNPRDQIPYNTRSLIYVYDLNKKEYKSLNIEKFPRGMEFSIHGLDIIEDEQNKNVLYLFAINHRPKSKDQVEHFRYEIGSDNIEYIRSFEDEEFQNLNSIAVVSKDSFYVTKDLTHVRGLRNLLETIGILEGGKILFKHSNNPAKISMSGFKIANGLTFSHNKKILYMAETLRGMLHIYSRNVQTNSLTLLKSIDLGFNADNLNIDPKSNSLYLSAFPATLSAIISASNYATPKFKPIHSIALKITDLTTEDGRVNSSYKVIPLLSDLSGLLSGTSVVASSEERKVVLISGLFNSRGLVDYRL